MELPLTQAAAALLIRMGVGPDTAMRILGLTGFQVAAILLCALVLRWHGELAAIVVSVLFQFSPYGLAWGAAALIDFPSVALSLGMVLGLDSWFRTASRVGLLLGVVTAWLAFLVKATTPPAWCLLVIFSAAAAYVSTRSRARTAVGLMAGPLVGILAGVAWIRYGDAIKVRNPVTWFLNSGNMREWNFGTPGQRLHPSAYGPVLSRIGSEIAGPIALGIVVAVVGILLAPTQLERFRRAGWLATAACAPMLFFSLYRVHNYYLIAIFPAIVAAVGVGIAAIAQRLSANTSLVAAVGIAIVIAGSAVPQDIEQWLTSPAPSVAGQRIRSATGPADLIVVVGCDWDPSTLYFADRRGLMLRNDNPEVWARENIDAYQYLYSCEPTADIARYLPPGYEAKRTSTPGLSRLAKLRAHDAS
ncbi:hypothetical protein [Mycobacterium sp. 23]|uniref:hypothetical protein n=1 Tax=Mycobacterium sp. 23 TaxID=3400424 RepID=UPI003AAE07EC